MDAIYASGQNSQMGIADDFEKVFVELRSDVDAICRPRIDPSTRQYLYSDPIALSPRERRALVRAVFSFVEGMAHFLRQMLVKDGVHKLNPATRLALMERQIEVTGSGSVRTTRLRVGALVLLRLTIESYRHIFPTVRSVECSGDGFDALAATVNVRDRLMHPKAGADLDVTDKEIRQALTAFAWFNDSTAVLLEPAVRHLENYVDNLKALSPRTVTNEDH